MRREKIQRRCYLTSRYCRISDRANNSTAWYSEMASSDHQSSWKISLILSSLRYPFPLTCISFSGCSKSPKDVQGYRLIPAQPCKKNTLISFFGRSPEGIIR